ncbi:AbrB/MazE/SpoVT family DNA-binding domain-containing protein [Salsipaludibacter albus]|uniref:AbrB/MazE/SpoVT family DNA-binding domain-containing protein n=1 Tax=Salsipaludibacter albus TaxID=2849650 RepID=UPI001EE40416|nr:AbrB/MazE/SpoVT family DNA-binding domain-containing protein [Salsipaludibacter albus]MBY5162072.1 AbrB/MazE/SpoVT family DNA-binding domain-containing protein [Salsipaludibacter albus]
MGTTVKVDRQGRIVIPQHERERLGLHDGGVLELIPTPEGIALEHLRPAIVRQARDGLPVVAFGTSDTIPNDDAVAAIHRHRDQR